MRRFLVAAIAAAVPLIAITTVLALRPINDTFVDAVRDLGQTVPALVAVISCGLMAARNAGRTRWAWALLAASASSALVGELGEAVYTVWLRIDAPFPSAADVGIVGAVPLAIAGLLAFPAASNQFATRRRALLDLAMVALSLTFISLALSLPQAYLRSAPPLLWWVGPAFPVADVAIITVIFVSLRRSVATQGGRLLLVVGGLAINAFSDSAAAFLLASGSLPTLAYLFGAGSMYGYTMIALAPLWPEPKQQDESVDIVWWRALLPYFGVTAVAATAIVLWLAHLQTSPYIALPGAGLLLVLIASQLLSHAEERALLRQSRRAEAMVREREAMLNNLIDHAPQGVASIAVDRRILNANPRLASMLYAPLQALVGATTDSFLPSDYVARVFKGLEPSGDGTHDTYEADCQARRGDGSQLWVHWSVTPIRKADGLIDYFMVTFEDVTAKREAEETAVANLAQLEKLSRLKSEFVSMVSHEFRTGLVGIQGFSELIRDQDMDATEVKALAEEINHDAQRLGRMITDMLDFDRLEAGKIRLDLKPLDLNELVCAAIERASVSTQKHFLKTELQPSLPEVLGDGDRLTQVLTNLLSNAIKYSPDGGEICAGTRLNGGAVEVAVRDHGRGIPPEFINRLFGRYERYEDKHAGKIIGTGLGLAITRQIVEMHGGRIAVDSVVGAGSEFRFTVPLAPTVAAPVTRSA
jgi:PAS domain S-box-containing protein